MTLEYVPYEVLEAEERQRRPGAGAAAGAADLVVLDVAMPGLNGIAMCEALKSDPATDHIKVVMLSALAQSSKREGACWRAPTPTLPSRSARPTWKETIEGLLAVPQPHRLAATPRPSRTNAPPKAAV